MVIVGVSLEGFIGRSQGAGAIVLLRSPVEEATVGQFYFGVAIVFIFLGSEAGSADTQGESAVDKWVALSLDLEPSSLSECQSFQVWGRHLFLVWMGQLRPREGQGIASSN